MNYDNKPMTSSRPYLVRAFNEWIIDNEMTPYVVINATIPGVRVPKQYIENGRIILNISPFATQALIIDNTKIEFKASFGGVLQQVIAPIKAIEAIYAKETGKGMIFSEDDENTAPTPEVSTLASTDGDDDDSGGDGSGRGKRQKGHLRVVK